MVFCGFVDADLADLHLNIFELGDAVVCAEFASMLSQHINCATRLVTGPPGQGPHGAHPRALGLALESSTECLLEPETNVESEAK